MDKELGLKVLARTFAIGDVEEMESEVDFTQLTKNRVKFVKNTYGTAKSLSWAVGIGAYTYALETLKKYGTDEMADRYAADNKKAYEQSLASVTGCKFFIDTDKGALDAYISKYADKNAVWHIEETEYNGKTYYVAYN